MLHWNIDLEHEKAYVSEQIFKYGRCRVCEIPCKQEPFKFHFFVLWIEYLNDCSEETEEKL